LTYIDQLKEVKGTESERTIVGDNRNVMREDVPSQNAGVYTRALVDAAPSHEGDFIKVKKILS